MTSFVNGELCGFMTCAQSLANIKYFKGGLEEMIQDIVNISDSLIIRGRFLMNSLFGLFGALTNRDEDFSWLGGDGDGTFDALTKKAQGVGNSAIKLVKTFGIIALVIAIMCIAVSFMVNKNANKREENKTWIVWLIIGGVFLFGSLGCIGWLASVGSSIF